LRQQFTGPHLPAISTVHAGLDRYNLVKRRRRRRHTVAGTELSRPTDANALWCADDKGEFMLGKTSDCQARTKNGHPPQSTTGVARASSAQRSVVGAARCSKTCPGKSWAIVIRTNGPGARARRRVSGIARRPARNPFRELWP
jgi:hypothetical protein